MTGADEVLCYVGIGSNLGDPAVNCRLAIDALSADSNIRLKRVSSLYITEPVREPATCETARGEEPPWYVNAVAEIKTRLKARGLLETLMGIEQGMGRVRQEKGAPRVIDLDLLFYGQDMIDEPDLRVPHPEAHKRRFVLTPICEIASHVIHPAFGISMRGLYERLKDEKQVKKYQDSRDKEL